MYLYMYDKSSSNGKVAKQQQTYYLDYTFVETTIVHTWWRPHGWNVVCLKYLFSLEYLTNS